MAHRYRHTEKEAHLLSGPSELQPPDASEARKLRSPTQVQQSGQEYSQLTENPKAKFHITYIPNEERNYVECHSVKKYQATLSTRQNQILPLFLILYFQKEGRKSQKMLLHLQKTYLHLHLQKTHLHPHWRQ